MQLKPRPTGVGIVSNILALCSRLLHTLTWYGGKTRGLHLLEKSAICGHCVFKKVYAGVSVICSPALPRYGAPGPKLLMIWGPPRVQIASGLGLPLIWVDPTSRGHQIHTQKFPDGRKQQKAVHILCYLEARNTCVALL